MGLLCSKKCYFVNISPRYTPVVNFASVVSSFFLDSLLVFPKIIEFGLNHV